MVLKRNAVSIVGIGESALGVVPGSSSMALSEVAAIRALEDAGIKKEQVDGLLALPSYLEYNVRYSTAFAEYFGLSAETLNFVDTPNLGAGSSSGHAIQTGCAAIISGLCDTLLIVAGDNFRSYGGTGKSGRDAALTGLAMNRHKEFENPYGPLVVSTYGLTAQRYDYEYGDASVARAHVAVSARDFAQLQPSAQMYGSPLTVEDVMQSSVIASPLRKLDSALISDGACAMVLTRSDRVQGFMTADTPVRVVTSVTTFADGEGLVHDSISQSRHLFMHREGSGKAGRRALSEADLARDDVDVVFLYGPFTITPLLILEGLGYCGPGEGSDYVLEQGIGSAAKVPVNPHGGLLSYCHPGYPGGMFMFIEATRQLRGSSPGYQVPEAEVAMIQGYGTQLGMWPSTILAKG